MPNQTRATSTPAEETTTAATGEASHQPIGQGTSGPAGGWTGPGSPLSLPIPGLPGGVTPKRVLWWGGLAAVAAVGLIEWPVAAVVGAGTYVAEKLAREDSRHDTQQP